MDLDVEKAVYVKEYNCVIIHLKVNGKKIRLYTMFEEITADKLDKTDKLFAKHLKEIFKKCGESAIPSLIAEF